MDQAPGEADKDATHLPRREVASSAAKIAAAGAFSLTIPTVSASAETKSKIKPVSTMMGLSRQQPDAGDCGDDWESRVQGTRI